MLLLAGLVAACGRSVAAPTSPVRIEAVADSGGYRLRLFADPGARVNARLRPALELTGGQVIRFDQSVLTPDSSYFALPAEATLTVRMPRLRGLLRVGICPAEESICRALSVRIDQPLPEG